MIPAPFDYVRAGSVDEAVAALGEHGDDAKLLAGGMSLLPLMKLRFAQPAHVVDLRHVSSLRGVRRESTARVIGAMTTYAELATSSDVQAGRLHRLVRLVVVHAFDRRDCCLDGDWIKCE